MEREREKSEEKKHREKGVLGKEPLVSSEIPSLPSLSLSLSFFPWLRCWRCSV